MASYVICALLWLVLCSVLYHSHSFPGILIIGSTHLYSCKYCFSVHALYCCCTYAKFNGQLEF